MQIVVDDLLVSYITEGAKKNQIVLWLHGWGDTVASSASMRAQLASDHHVIALNLPGFGGSQAPADAWGLNEYGTFLSHFVKKLDISVDILVGHSNGGAIAIRSLASGSLHAKKLILLASSGVRNTYNGRKKMLRLAAKSAKVITKPLPSRIQNKLKTKAYASIGSEMLVAEHMQETFKKIVTDDVQADTHKITIPTLLIYGYDDTATPVQYGELLQAGLSHSELHMVPRAGHFVYLDKPDVVLSLMKEFLA